MVLSAPCSALERHMIRMKAIWCDVKSVFFRALACVLKHSWMASHCDPTSSRSR
jgi:hypothetical protein